MVYRKFHLVFVLIVVALFLFRAVREELRAQYRLHNPVTRKKLANRFAKRQNKSGEM